MNSILMYMKSDIIPRVVIGIPPMKKSSLNEFYHDDHENRDDEINDGHEVKHKIM